MSALVRGTKKLFSVASDAHSLVEGVYFLLMAVGAVVALLIYLARCVLP